MCAENFLRGLSYVCIPKKTVPYSHSATQPLSHSARAAEPATQPLCQSGWTSHSATQPLSQSGRTSHSATQPLSQSGWTSHSATLPEWLDQPLSHSPRVAGPATQPLSPTKGHQQNTDKHGKVLGMKLIIVNSGDLTNSFIERKLGMTKVLKFPYPFFLQFLTPQKNWWPKQMGVHPLFRVVQENVMTLSAIVF